MEVKILLRASLAEEDELNIASSYIHVIRDRALIRKDDLIVPRYSLLPYPNELERDCHILGGTLINTTRQHHYVADIEQWYYDFEDVTPKTWFRLDEIPRSLEHAFILKGATNSRKHLWKTHMFASSVNDISNVLNRLLDDPLISAQGICAREFEKFKSFDIPNVGSMPVTNEWRFFILDGQVLAYGFYWSEHVELLMEKSLLDLKDGQAACEFVNSMIAPRLEDKIRFVVADVAMHSDGRWRLVELNDGCMSGISCINMHELYGQLYQRIT